MRISAICAAAAVMLSTAPAWESSFAEGGSHVVANNSAAKAGADHSAAVVGALESFRAAAQRGHDRVGQVVPAFFATGIPAGHPEHGGCAVQHEELGIPRHREEAPVGRFLDDHAERLQLGHLSEEPWSLISELPTSGDPLLSF